MKATFKGQINKETEKAIEVTIISDAGLEDTWIPKSALDTKQMPVDCLSIKGTQIFYIHSWYIDLKAKNQREADTISPEKAVDDAVKISKDLESPPTYPFEDNHDLEKTIEKIVIRKLKEIFGGL